MAKQLLAISVAILIGVAFSLCNAVAQEKFKKLSGSEIRAKLTGMEISDESHWGDVYGRNGTVTTYSMGHKSVGKWSVRKDALLHRQMEGAGRRLLRSMAVRQQGRVKAARYRVSVRRRAAEADRYVVKASHR